MIFSADQTRAIDSVGAWLKNNPVQSGKPYYYLAGFAGCGKTTLAKHLASLQDGATKFATYTGKAALVLSKKGCPATTIHSLIYMPQSAVMQEIQDLEAELSAGVTPAREQIIYRRLAKLREPSFTLRMRDQLAGCSLLVIDEVSMLNAEMANDLLSYGIPILVLGDPGQLPPIEGTGFFTNRTPDFMLTEIHRQAAESPVIRLATLAREGKPIKFGDYGTSKAISRMKISKPDALEVSQILCGSNKARIQMNAENRQLRGLIGQFPVVGDRVICLRNNPKQLLLNGTMAEVMEDYDIETKKIKIKTDDDITFETSIHPECFTNPERVKAWDYRQRCIYNEFDYGWAITGHRAQGSQWPSVLVFADMFRWDSDLFKKWLYTSLTRAEDRVILAL